MTQLRTPEMPAREERQAIPYVAIALGTMLALLPLDLPFFACNPKFSA
jgi:hypothetical protein